MEVCTGRYRNFSFRRFKHGQKKKHPRLHTRHNQIYTLILFPTTYTLPRVFVIMNCAFPNDILDTSGIKSKMETIATSPLCRTGPMRSRIKHFASRIRQFEEEIEFVRWVSSGVQSNSLSPDISMEGFEAELVHLHDAIVSARESRRLLEVESSSVWKEFKRQRRSSSSSSIRSIQYPNTRSQKKSKRTRTRII